ncbi:LacI family DNA-binding transcriptional regulator [Staphylococcus simulans]|uniref:LacI family DNA-binding transcriptional regulator n=1 Tax=Staphylococcus simulans TaxID=1286 RepID=UPI0021D00C88|nr:LacI family DNA-binding transcriptional regulator [Staphylococcus simulans]UXV37684.1 LacI family transcriptional regulator [Staphylococcus simulans]UXV40132.1 LacI family transcriptional regulator [Staphylococcus simulans]
MTNVKDVAKLAEVSTATVSRVLTNTGNVSEKNRKKVLDAVEKLKYYPNSIGRQLRKMETKTILVVVPDITNSFFSNILRGIENRAGEKGYQVLLGDTQNKKADDYFKYLYEKQVDGMILLTSKLSLGTLKDIYDKFPVVLACETITGLDIPTVSINNIEAAETVTDYLIDLGHKKILHATGPLDGILGKNRLLGFENKMRQYNYSISRDSYIEGDFSLESGYRIGKQILKMREKPTAVFAANDEMAIGIIKILKKHKICVPEDISVVGFDNIKLAEIVDPELTTYSQPNYEIGEKAMKLLLEIIEKKEIEEKSIILNGELVERKSTVSN